MIEQNKITSIIVDDEYYARKALELLLNDIPSIEVIEQFDSVNKAIDFLSTHKTQLVFLDIHMSGKNGFELIEELKDLHLKPTIIFTTAYPQHAIEAFEEAAFGYLLKPIDPDKLRMVVNRFVCEIQNSKNLKMQKLKFNTRTGFILIEPEDIIYCKADNNYTKIFSQNEESFVVSQNIGLIEQKLNAENFYRLGRSYLINLQYLRKVIRKEKACVLDYNGKEVKLIVSDGIIRKLKERFN